MRWQWSARCAGWTPLRGAPTNQQFRFTSPPELRQPCDVRKSVAISLLVLAALSCVRGQDQERKLVDRLLKPDMTLQNDAQHTKFVADGTSMIQTGTRQGMMSLDQSLANLAKAKQITREDGLSKAQNVLEYESLMGLA